MGPDGAPAEPGRALGSGGGGPREGDVEDRGVTATVEFRFGPDGLPASIFAPDRARAVGSANVPTPWEGTWSAFGPRNGMRVPSAGEVAWLLPEGRLPYWRGRVVSVAYEFADGGPREECR